MRIWSIRLHHFLQETQLRQDACIMGSFMDIYTVERLRIWCHKVKMVSKGEVPLNLTSPIPSSFSSKEEICFELSKSTVPLLESQLISTESSPAQALYCYKLLSPSWPPISGTHRTFSHGLTVLLYPQVSTHFLCLPQASQHSPHSSGLNWSTEAGKLRVDNVGRLTQAKYWACGSLHWRASSLQI